jgi:type I restriction enzyme M protein
MAALEGRSPSPNLEEAYRWNSWAAPKDPSGQLAKDALVGDDLRDFVNVRLFPYLAGFKERASGSDTIE